MIAKFNTLAALIGLAAGVAAMAAYHGGHFVPFEERTLEVYKKLSTRPRSEPPPLAIVAVEDLADHSWPWSSLDYAILLNALAPYYPEVVAFEVPMFGGDPIYEVYDTQLANQMSRLNAVVLGSTVLQSSVHLARIPPVDRMPFRGDIERMPVYQSAYWPLFNLTRNSSIGFTNLVPDADGVIRRVPLIFRFRDMIAPSWVLQIYARFLAADWTHSIAVVGSHIELRGAADNFLARIPIDAEGKMTVHYAPLDSRIGKFEFYAAILAAEQIRGGKIPVVPISEIRRKIVVVGRESPETHIPILTPVGIKPPLDVYIQALQTLVKSTFIRPLGSELSWALVLFLAFLSSQAALIRYSLSCVATFSIMVTALSMGAFLLFDMTGIYAPVATTFAAISAAWILTVVIKPFHLEAMKALDLTDALQEPSTKLGDKLPHDAEDENKSDEDKNDPATPGDRL